MLVLKAYVIQSIAKGSRRRAPSMPPMSIVGHPNAESISATFFFASALLPQMNMSGGPPGKFGLTMCVFPTVLNALTTYDFGNQRCTCSPAESVCPNANDGGEPGLTKSGLVASITIFPAS